MELAEADRPKRAHYKGQGSLAGGNVLVNAAFDLSPASEGTKIAWQGETQIFGRLTSLAGGLLEPLGRKNAQRLIDSLQIALNATAIPSSAIQANAGGTTPANQAISTEINNHQSEPAANQSGDGVQP
jgi:Carbon monoxide dehydrogenase subunit G (CoxG)